MGWDDIGKLLLALFIPWSGWVTWTIRMIRRDTAHLVVQHDNPEHTGFGTVGHVDAMRDLARAIRELTHFTKWQGKQVAGQEPPPYMEAPE